MIPDIWLFVNFFGGKLLLFFHSFFETYNVLFHHVNILGRKDLINLFELLSRKSILKFFSIIIFGRLMFNVSFFHYEYRPKYSYFGIITSIFNSSVSSFLCFRFHVLLLVCLWDKKNIQNWNGCKLNVCNIKFEYSKDIRSTCVEYWEASRD